MKRVVPVVVGKVYLVAGVDALARRAAPNPKFFGPKLTDIAPDAGFFDLGGLHTTDIATRHARASYASHRGPRPRKFRPLATDLAPAGMYTHE
jgi:hypothetical protein